MFETMDPAAEFPTFFLTLSTLSVSVKYSELQILLKIVPLTNVCDDVNNGIFKLYSAILVLSRVIPTQHN